MRKTKTHIAFSYLLLMIFLSWQSVMFTHHHKSINSCDLTYNKHLKAIFHFHKLETEKCLLCVSVIHDFFSPQVLISVIFRQVLDISIPTTQKGNYYSLLKNLKARAPPLHK
jgi:hypothetical protein